MCFSASNPTQRYAELCCSILPSFLIDVPLTCDEGSCLCVVVFLSPRFLFLEHKAFSAPTSKLPYQANPFFPGSSKETFSFEDHFSPDALHTLLLGLLFIFSRKKRKFRRKQTNVSHLFNGPEASGCYPRATWR